MAKTALESEEASVPRCEDHSYESQAVQQSVPLSSKRLPIIYIYIYVHKYYIYIYISKMIARHPLYTPTTGSRVGSNQRPPYRSHPQPFPVGIHLGDQTPPPAFPLPPTRNLPRRPDDLAHGLVLLNTFPSPPRQLPDPVQELPGPAGASQSCIDVHRPWRMYIYMYIYIYTQSARALGFDA